MLNASVTASPTEVEGRRCLWLSAQPCVPQEVAGESNNLQHVAFVVQSTGGLLGVPLVAWLSLEPQNAYDANAVMIWMSGGKVGYLPRADAVHWQPIVSKMQQQGQLPVACGAYVEMPPESAGETAYQVVLWLPPLPWQAALTLSAQDMAIFMARAQREPRARAERLHAKAVERQTADAKRMDDLVARHGRDAADRIVAKELWLGATEGMITDTFGAPDKVDEKVFKTKTKRTLSYAGECPKCDGLGVITEFIHVNDGTCFACKGSGKKKAFVLRVRLENGAVVGWDKN